MSQEMVIFVRVFELLQWLLPKSEQFPKSFRNTLTQRIMDATLDLQEMLIEAQSRRGQQRLQALRKADDCLVKLRVYMRLIHQWQWLSHNQYQHVSKMLDEIGRLLGGWLKQVDAKPL